MDKRQTTLLPARPPFSLPAVVRSHGWIQLAPLELRRRRATSFISMNLAPEESLNWPSEKRQVE
jgi:hypothetical protein